MWHTQIFSRLADHDNSYVKSYVKSDGLGEIQHTHILCEGVYNCRFEMSFYISRTHR